MKILNPPQPLREPAAAFPWLWLALLSAGLMLAGGLGLWLLDNQSPGPKTPLHLERAALALASSATPTPFMPLTPGLTPVRTLAFHPTQEMVLDSAQQTDPQTPEPFWKDFDFSDGADPLEIHLVDPQRVILGGKPVQIRFSPGAECVFGDGQACVSSHANGQYLLLTVHSGVTGQGQQLRHAFEGTGINTAGLSTAEIQANLLAMRSAIVSLHQNITNLDYLSVAAAIRIAPEKIAEYYQMPFLQAAAWAAQEDPDLLQFLEDGVPLIFIETCGWPVVGEPSAGGDYQGTGSIYLVAIHARD